ILPDHSFLESWVDSRPESGSLEPASRVFGPVMKPLHQTRATGDVLIEVAGKLKSPIALPWKTAEEVAKSEHPAPSPQSPQAARSPERLALRKYSEPIFDGDAAQYPFPFLPYMLQEVGHGSTAHLP